MVGSIDDVANVMNNLDLFLSRRRFSLYSIENKGYSLHYQNFFD